MPSPTHDNGPEDERLFAEADLLCVYSRAQAIEDAKPVLTLMRPQED